MNEIRNSTPTGRSYADSVLKGSHGVSLEQASTDNLYGLNIINGSRTHTQPKERPGKLFIVKPQLNFSDYNILRNPELYDLATSKKVDVHTGHDGRNTAWNYVRCVLDPRYGRIPGNKPDFLDDKMAFITPFSNEVLSVTGWPSKVLPTRETTPGLFKQSTKLPDGVRHIYGNFDLDVVVRNDGTGIFDKILDSWEEYIALNHIGNIMPYPDISSAVKFDFHTRAYRLVMCDADIYVRHIACTGWSMPVNTEDGKKYDLTAEDTYAKDNSTRTIRLASTGAWYDDMRAMTAFNWSVGVFNHSMLNINLREAKGEETGMIKVPREFVSLVENRAYPNINLETFELEWWIEENKLEKIDKPEIKPEPADTGGPKRGTK